MAMAQDPDMELLQFFFWWVYPFMYRPHIIIYLQFERSFNSHDFISFSMNTYSKFGLHTFSDTPATEHGRSTTIGTCTAELLAVLASKVTEA